MPRECAWPAPVAPVVCPSLAPRRLIMAAYFAAHPDHAFLFAFGCFALTVYLFRYAGPGIGGGGDWSSRDHYERNLRDDPDDYRSEEHTSELQSLMRISYAVFCLKKKNINNYNIQI